MISMMCVFICIKEPKGSRKTEEGQRKGNQIHDRDGDANFMLLFEVQMCVSVLCAAWGYAIPVLQSSQNTPNSLHINHKVTDNLISFQ